MTIFTRTNSIRLSSGISIIFGLAFPLTGSASEHEVVYKDHTQNKIAWDYFAL